MKLTKHPSVIISEIMGIIYKGEMTTLSGGNISMLDEEGNLWISPAGYDKGSLTPKDIVCVKKDGSYEGIHRPSSEFPFHYAIYDRRPDLKAVIHAHPKALVSFSIVREIPDMKILPHTADICPSIGYAPYRLPGSEALGESIANEFEKGFDAVIMENHGTVVGGKDLLSAFQRFEAMETAALSIIDAKKLGGYNVLTDEQVQKSFTQFPQTRTGKSEIAYTTYELAVRDEIIRFVKRACKQKLMNNYFGTVSHRTHGDDFLVTRRHMARRFIRNKDVVKITKGESEAGKEASNLHQLHEAIYAKHDHVNSVIFTQGKGISAFAISDAKFDTRTIPESYILLKDIPFIGYDEFMADPSVLVNTLNKETPIVVIRNFGLVVTGTSMLDAYDRLEVAEFSAESLIESTLIGKLARIGDGEIQDIVDKFLS
ncbi:class II aldolase/adducin family protein [Persicobacter psychrovividus]|uniref:L-fuculose-phosphate aldolase n=1 Tax=Persicobacter psychrovividus TaxID=387638 RepID=A0ABM7VIF8_9BACT|nr:L-fuculose-phosphate aldolase [Persicobacter psychrovividus]